MTSAKQNRIKRLKVKYLPSRYLTLIVGMRRLELPTSTSRTWRASQLCYIPIFMSCNRFGSTVLDYGCKGTTLF